MTEKKPVHVLSRGGPSISVGLFKIGRLPSLTSRIRSVPGVIDFTTRQCFQPGYQMGTIGLVADASSIIFSASLPRDV